MVMWGRILDMGSWGLLSLDFSIEKLDVGEGEGV